MMYFVALFFRCLIMSDLGLLGFVKDAKKETCRMGYTMLNFFHVFLKSVKSVYLLALVIVAIDGHLS